MTSKGNLGKTIKNEILGSLIWLQFNEKNYKMKSSLDAK